MLKSIIFLGKFQPDLIDLQEQVINLSKKQKKDVSFKKIDYDPNQMPDVIKYTTKNYDCSIWTLINDVKPTLLLKDLIKDSQIILFFFYFSDLKTLEYLIDGWGPIIDRVENINQERLLIGITKGKPSYDIKKIQSVMKQLKCKQYFEEGSSTPLSKLGSIPVRIDLIEYIRAQITSKSAPLTDYKSESTERIEQSKSSLTRKSDKKQIQKHPTSKDEIKNQSTKERSGSSSSKISDKKLITKASSESSEYKDDNDDKRISKPIKSKNKSEKQSIIKRSGSSSSKISNKKIIANSSSESSEYKYDNDDNEITQCTTYSDKNKSKPITYNSSENDYDKDEVEYDITNVEIKSVNVNFIYNLSSKNLTAKIVGIMNSYYSYLTSLTISDAIEYKGQKYEIIEICENCFKDPTKINSILFKTPKIILDDLCFNNCESLSTITFIDCSFIETFCNSFESCQALKTIRIKTRTDIEIKDSSFLNIPNLDLLEIECQRIIIGDNCFRQTLPNKKARMNHISQSYNSNYLYKQTNKISIKSTSDIEIGSQCFYGLNNVKSIEFDGKDINIKNGCFNKCESLTTFNIPGAKNLTINTEQFKSCPKLKELKISSKSKITLLEKCFFAVNKLQQITLESPDISIGESCFENCSEIFTFYLKNAANIKILNNAFLNCNKLSSISTEATEMITFGDSCFKNCSALKVVSFKESKSVTMRSSIRMYKASIEDNIIEKLIIGQRCFDNCTSLTSFKFKNAKKAIFNSNSFNGCQKLISFSITNNDDIEFLTKVFNNDDKLKTIEIEGKNIKLNNNIIDNCCNLTSISIISESSINISKDTFKLNNTLLNITIKTESTIGIGNDSFYDMSNLETIQLEGEKVIIESNCFSDSTSKQKEKIMSDLEIIPHNKSPIIKIISKSDAEIGSKCFNGLFKISSIDIKGRSIKIQKECFNKLESLTSLKLTSESTINISGKCFCELTRLETIQMKGDQIILNDNCIQRCFLTQKTSKPSNNYDKTKTTNKILIDSVKFDLGSHCFNELTYLNSIEMRCNSINIKNGWFNICKNLTMIDINSEFMLNILENSFCDIPKLNIILMKSQQMIIGDKCFKNTLNIENKSKSNSDSNLCSYKQLNKSIIDASKLKIGEQCFYGLINLESYELYSKSISIKKECFNKCESLAELKLTSKSSMEISEKCFNELTKLENIQMKGDQIILDDNCIQKCFLNQNKSQSKILIESFGKLEIGNECFNELTYLKSIELNSKIINIKKECFYKCESLSLFNIIGSNEITINSKQFSYCNELKKLILSSKMNINLMNECFSSTNKLEMIELETPYITIGESCFENCSTIATVKITKASNVIISDKAFSNCNKFFSISLDAGESITFCNNCFKNCSSLKDVLFQENKNIKSQFKYQNVPNIFNYLKIESNSFENCKSLSTFKCVTARKIYISSNSFKGCNKLTNISFSRCEIIEFEKNCIIGNNELKSINIQGNNISMIDTFVNNCSTLTSINISSEQPIIITNDLFNLCKSISSIKLNSKTIIEIKEGSFCYLNKLGTIHLEGEQIIIEDRCFKNTNSNNNFSNQEKNTIEIKSKTDIIIGCYCFYNINNLETIEIEGTSIVINNECFNTLNSIKKLILTSSEKITLGQNLFVNCSDISKLFLTTQNVHLNQRCFSSTSKINFFEISSTIVTIDDHLIQKGADISSIRIYKSDNINIGDNAFLECSKLSSISFEASKSIVLGNCCFKNCSLLKSIYFQKYKIYSNQDQLNKLEIKLGRCCFMNCDKVIYTSFQGISKAELSNDVFNGAKNLENIEINSNDESLTIGDNCFIKCISLKKVNLTSKTSLILSSKCFKGLANLESIQLKGSSIKIGNDCFIDSFSESRYNQNISINASELSIGNNCFQNCKYLSSISYSNSKNIKIGSKAFSECISLNKVYITSSSTIFICEKCFEGLENLQEATLNSKDIIIDKFSFKDCKSLLSISFYSDLTNLKILNNSFENCEKLEKIYFQAKSSINISDYCFNKCPNLKKVIFKCEELNLGNYCFNECKYLTCFYFYEVKKAQIHSNIFSGCDSLKTFKAEISLQTIVEDFCFCGATNLESIELNSKDLIIGSHIFGNSNKISKATLKYENQFDIKPDAFDGCNSQFKPEITQSKK